MVKLTTILLALLLLACTVEAQKLDCSPYSCDDEKIKTWYQKKYGEPITEFELLTKMIEFSLLEKNAELYEITIDRTGSLLEPFNTQRGYSIEHSLEEWFDFIRALRKCIYEWKEIYGDTKKGYDIEWILTIYQGDEEKEGPNSKFIIHNGFDAYPENWKEFEKIINNIKTKIEETGKLKYIYGPEL